MELKPYLQYREATLPWLNRIPENWKVDRAKNLFGAIDIRSTTGKEELLTVSAAHGVIPRKSANVTMFKAKSYVGYKLCWPGDLAVNSLWAWMQGLGFSKYHGIISTAYGVYRLKRSYADNYHFFDYLIRSAAYLWELRVRSKGIWRSRYQLTDESFLCMPILLPPKEEQQKIVSFLDSKTKQFSRFIRSKQKLIKLLKEQKQVIINQAVTKGLDPNVQLKPSGVDWLGDIPGHWEVRRLRTIATVKPSGVDKNTVNGEIPISLCNYVDVYKNDYITSELSFMKATACQAEIDTFKLKAGDIIITKDSEDWTDIAVPAYVLSDLEDVICAYHLAMIRPKEELILGEYLFRAFGSEMIANQFRVSAYGITRYGLSQNAIKSAFIPVPPVKEQEKIIEYINERCTEANSVLIKANREIALIREYRTRLISDVVTGKVDVRDILVEPVEEEEIEDVDEFAGSGGLEELQEVADADD